MLSVSHACAWPVNPCRSRSGVRPSPPQSRRCRRTPFTTTSRSRGCRRFIRSRAPLLLRGESELLLEDEPHFRRGGAPQGATRRVVLGLDHLAVLVHGRVLLVLVLRRCVHRLRTDRGDLGGRRVRALDPAADLVPVLVEED